MKLSKTNSYAVSVIQYTFDADNPYSPNLCQFFWVTVIALLLSPAAFVHHISKAYNPLLDGGPLDPPPVIMGFLISAMLLILGMLGWISVTSPGFGLGMLGFAAFVMFIILLKAKTEVVTITGNMAYGVYHNLCPLIEWTD